MAAMAPAVTVVVVSYAEPAAAVRAIESVLTQSPAPIEVLVVDNDPASRTVSALSEASPSPSPSVRIVHSGVNLGYAQAVNLAAQQAKGDWLFLLNPDAVACKGCLRELLDAVDGPDVAIVGAQVLLPDGRTNAGDNPISIVGISWSGRYGQSRERGPARDVAAVSGAALLTRRDAFLAVGGLCPYFFLYVDDTDLAWRMRLSGRRVRYCPEATVVHDYEFAKGSHKWFYLERNRAWALLSNLQIRTLVFLAPVLAAVELAVLARSVSERWLGEKLRVWASLLRQWPSLVRWRRQVQRSRNLSDYRVLQLFSAGVETDLIDLGPVAWANRCLEAYRRLVLRLLEITSR